MIKEAYVSFEVAKLLKEKGFKEECSYRYVAEPDYKTPNFVCSPIGNGSKYLYNAPTHQTAMAWLRQTYKINIVIMPAVADKDGDGGCLYKYIIFRHTEVVYKSECLYEKYSVACDDSLKYVLENLI